MNKRIIIEGEKVKKVGYRLFLFIKARELKIKNYESHNDDKEQKLVVLLGGSDNQISEFIEFAENNHPEGAKVSKLTADDNVPDVIMEIDEYWKILDPEQQYKMINGGKGILEILDKQLEIPELEITEEDVPELLSLRDNTGECHMEVHRIEVKNKGKIAVENVYGIIENLNTHNMHESRTSWHEGEKDVPYTTINAGDHMFLNIYGIIHRRSSNRLMMEPTYNITMATENGWNCHVLVDTSLDLKFAIRVTAKNTSPKRKIFKISRNNNLKLEFLNND